MPGGKRPGAGRPKGVPNRQGRDLREMMETICKGEPVPVVLLKLGLKYHQDGMHADAIRAVSEACKYGYAQLKAIEHSGAVQAGPAVVVEMIVSDEPASKPAAP